jgi:hypothetical protein
MRFVTIALAVGAAAVGTLALAAATPSPLAPPPPPGTGLPTDQCVSQRDIGNHSVVDKKTLLLDVGGRHKGVYRLSMRSGCLGSAISSDQVSFHQVSGDSLCKPKNLTLTVRGGICIVDSIVKMSPEEVAALPQTLKP